MMSHRQEADLYGEDSSEDVVFYDADDFGYSDRTQKHDQVVLAQGDPTPQALSTPSEGGRPERLGMQWPEEGQSDTRPATARRSSAKPSERSAPSTQADWPYRAPEPKASTPPAGTSSQPATPYDSSPSTSEPFQWPYHGPTSRASPLEEKLHVNTPHASTLKSSYQSFTSPREQSDDTRISTTSDPSVRSESTAAVTDDPGYRDDEVTVVGSEPSFSKAQAPALRTLSDLFGPSIRGAPHESPVSPLTARDRFPKSLSQASSATDFAPHAPVSRSPLSQEQPEPDFEGISLQQQLFSRPLSQRSSTASTTSSRRAPNILTTAPGSHGVASKLFLDPLGPQDDDQPRLGLPNLRHILDAAEDVTATDGELERLPDLFGDGAKVNHLETLQRDASDCWESASALPGVERQALVEEIVSRLWHTSVYFLAELLRSHRMLRRLANVHRLSLGEIDKLRRHSEDVEGKVVEQKQSVNIDLQALKLENNLLRQQLAMRDVGVAQSKEETSPEHESLGAGVWIAKRPLVPSSSSRAAGAAGAADSLEALGDETQADDELGTTPKQQGDTWAGIQPLLGSRSRGDEIQRRSSWQDDFEIGERFEGNVQKKYEDLEARVEERDHVVKKLNLQLKDIENELQNERRELNEARFEAETREEVIANLRGELNEKKKEVTTVETEMGMLVREFNSTQAELAEMKQKKRQLEEELYDQGTRIGELAQDLDYERNLTARKEAEVQKTKDELAVSLQALQQHCAGLERQIMDYEAALAQREAAMTQMQRDYDLLRDELLDEGLKKLNADEEIETHKGTIENLRRENQSIGETNRRLAEHLKSLGQEEGFRDLEELRLRRQKFQQQRAAWAPAILDLTTKNGHAEQRYRQRHQALMSAQRDLAMLRQERLVDIEREKQQMEIIAALERECRNARRAFREARLRLAIAKQLDQPHERDIGDIEDILRVLEPEETAENPEATDPTHQELLLSPNMQGKIATRTIEHHHGQACFCSLVDYWFPGALDRVLPHRPLVGDSGYDSDSDGHHDFPGLDPAPESPWGPDDDGCDDTISAAKDRQTSTSASSNTSPSIPGPTRETHRAHKETIYVETDAEDISDPQVQRQLSLRGGADEPTSPGSEKSAGYEEKMASFTTTGDLTDPWSLDPNAEPDSKVQGAAVETLDSSPLAATQKATQSDNEDLSQSGGDDGLGASDIGGPSEIQPANAEVKSSAAGGLEVESGSTEPAGENDPTITRGRHRTRASESIDAERRADGGIKLTIRRPRRPSSDAASGLESPALEMTARTTETQSPEDEAEQAGRTGEESSREEPSEEESLKDEPSQQAPVEDETSENDQAEEDQSEQEAAEAPSDKAESEEAELEEESAETESEEADSGGKASEAAETEGADSERPNPEESGSEEVDLERPDPEVAESEKAESEETETGGNGTEEADLEGTKPEKTETGEAEGVGSEEAGLEGAKPEVAESETGGLEEAEAEEAQQREAEHSAEESEEAVQEEAIQEAAIRAQATPRKVRSSPPQPAPPQRASSFPRRRPRQTTTTAAAASTDPTADLLSLLDAATRTPPLPSESPYPTRRPHRRHYHGHITSDGPFDGPGHFVCQLLTALTWLVLLILSQPSNLLHTVAILTGYFLIPLHYLVSLPIYYLVLVPLYHARVFLAWIFSRYPAAARSYPVPPAKPVRRKISAAAMVSSVVSLGVVFLVVALDVVRTEREVWVRANSWTAAYVRDLVDGAPYPWWSPVDVDFRLAAMRWVRLRMSVWAFGERYVRNR